MRDEILVNITLDEVRVAWFSQGEIQEIHVERHCRRSRVGNIYYGRVQRVLSGLRAAFIDIGLARPAFLDQKTHFLSLHPGDKLLVQIDKDGLGIKGPRLTTRLTLPGRWLILTPERFQMGVSKKITDEAVRKQLLSLISPGRFGGYVFRTRAEYASPEALLAESRLLDAEWEKIVEKMTSRKPPDCLYAALPLECRILRDLARKDGAVRIRVDDPLILIVMKEYAKAHCPELLECLEFHDNESPLFALHDAEKIFQRSLARKVALPSGGHLVFDQTEAMMTIDVNTGTPGKRCAEDLVFQTNREAVFAIAREVRLRNLGGIIIIDFIDMAETRLHEILLEALADAFLLDTASVSFSGMTRLGLVQMTRKRTRESLLHTLYEPCPHCQRQGMIHSKSTVAYTIVRALQQMSDKPWSGFLVQAAPEVVGFLEGKLPQAKTSLEKTLGRPVKWSADIRYRREAWDILPFEE